MLIVLLLLCAQPMLSQFPAQTTPPTPDGPTRIEGYRQPRFTMVLDDVPLKQALSLIAERAGLPLLYEDGTITKNIRVRVRLDNVGVTEALRRVTQGTHVSAQISPDGGSILVGRVIEHPDSVVQQRGSLIGSVIDTTTEEFIPNVSVALVGTRYRATTNVSGQFALFNLEAKSYTIIIQRIGYAPVKRSVVIEPGKTVTFSVAMHPAVSYLEKVVATATGVQRRIEVGNAISTIEADSLTANSLINNVTDLLAARAPGVQILRSGGSVGAPSRIRIRGNSSAVLSNDPIVIVDGVRMNAEATSGLNAQNQTGMILPIMGAAIVRPSARTTPSPLDYLDPNSIESIDILKGPSAASLYGTDAANGVIVIKTKRGQTGPARWSIRADRGWSYLPGKFPTSYYGLGRTDMSPETQLTSCLLENVAKGECTQERVVAFSPMNDKLTTTQGTGYQTRLYGDLSGGWPVFQYFLGGSLDHTLGTTRLPEIERRRILKEKGFVPSWQDRPNGMNSVNVSARAQMQPTAGLNMQSSLQVLTNDSWTAESGSGAEYVLGKIIDSTNFRPGDVFAQRTNTNRQRALGSAGLTYVQGQWLSLRSTVGLDYEIRLDKFQQEPGDCSVPNDCKDGSYSKYDGRSVTRNADLSGGIMIPLLPWLQSRTTVGGQYNRIRAQGTRITVTGTVLGLGSSNGALTFPPPEEIIDDAATAGIYVEQQFSIKDRLFLIAGLRRDAGSAFAGAPTYPKLSGSWILSRKPFFPQRAWISNVRLRTAYGHSGKQPRLTDLLRLYQPIQSYAFGSIGSGLIPLYLGNTLLRPERGKEWEGGFDLALFGERIQVEASAYRKVLHDALYGRVAAPSVGSTLSLSIDRNGIASMRYENIGSVENRGFELGLNARVLTSDMVSWDLTINASSNRNRVLKVASDTTQFGTPDEMIREGYPLFSQWRRPLLGYGDLNQDGLIDEHEITLGDTAIYMGAPYPKSERSYTSTVQLLGGRIRVSTMFQHTKGMMVLQGFYSTDRGVVDPTASLAQQALAVASKDIQMTADKTAASTSGYRQTADWLRFAELSLQYVLPPHIAKRLKARMTSVSLLGRNLGLWSRYRGGGFDPEVLSTPGADRELRVDNGTTIPQAREWTIRVNMAF